MPFEGPNIHILLPRLPRNTLASHTHSVHPDGFVLSVEQQSLFSLIHPPETGCRDHQQRKYNNQAAQRLNETCISNTTKLKPSPQLNGRLYFACSALLPCLENMAERQQGPKHELTADRQ